MVSNYDRYLFEAERKYDYLSYAPSQYKRNDNIHRRIMKRIVHKAHIELFDLEPSWSKSVMQTTRLLTHCYNGHDKYGITTVIHISTVVIRLKQLLQHIIIMYQVGDYLEVTLDHGYIQDILNKYAPLAGRIRYQYMISKEK